PFPQFQNINMLQVSEGVNRYNAGVVELTKRVTHGWGGRFSYTYSVLKDNQFGESNFYSNRNSSPMNNYNYDSTLPACTTKDRLGSADHPAAKWVTDAAITAAPAGTWGNAPRTITDVRTPRIFNTDLSVQKNIGLGGGKNAQIKLEIVNLFNRVQLNGFASTT